MSKYIGLALLFVVCFSFYYILVQKPDPKGFPGSCEEDCPDAVIFVQVLGVPHYKERMMALKEKYGFILLEDSCAALGAEYSDGSMVGTLGEMSSFSFYFGHQLSSIEGGMVYGTLQSRIGENEKLSPVQVILFETERYMKEYRVENQLAKEYEESIEDRFVNPSDEESTEAGEIEPEQMRRKNDIDIPYYSYAGYGYIY